jgi:hypothetical protein
MATNHWFTSGEWKDKVDSPLDAGMRDLDKSSKGNGDGAVDEKNDRGKRKRQWTPLAADVKM